MFRVVLFSVFCLPLAFSATFSAAETEAHVVSIYEPQIRSGEAYVAPEVEVRLDRLGADVRLVLGAYVPTRWQITTTDKTNLAEVILSGHGAKRGAVLVNGTAFARLGRSRQDIP